MTFHSRLPDYYSLLGVGEDASLEEVRQAFRRRAKQCHPDRDKSPEAKQAFLVLSEAYYVLRDEERRQTFDAFRGNQMYFEQPKQKPQRSRSRAWAACVAFACVIGVASFVATNIRTTPPPISQRDSSDATRLASVASPTADLVASPALVANPSVVAADDPSDAPEVPMPAVDIWQATASETQMPKHTTADILAEVPAPAPALAAAQKPVSPAATKSVAAPAAASPARPAVVVRPVASARRYLVATSVPRAQGLVRRSVGYAPSYAARAYAARIYAARAYAAAQASKMWIARQRQQAMRHAAKRRYAGY